MKCDLLNEADLCSWNNSVFALRLRRKARAAAGVLLPLQPSLGAGRVLLPSTPAPRLVLGTAWLPHASLAQLSLSLKQLDKGGWGWRGRNSKHINVSF